jgi:tRNA-dihydrouridine synthase B
MQIGHHQLKSKLILAPMAGISDRPFRELCKQMGAGLAVSEMVASNPALQDNRKTLLRAEHSNESGIRSVQIVGTNPEDMAAAAQLNVQRGADIIDINMGCPAKKVCAIAAGSALLRDEDLVKRILDAIVKAVEVPVTLKIRTGWDTENRNALNIAKIAENAGIAALTIHGRTRACKFAGHAEYETIRQVKQSVSIPIIANGDISTPETARAVLATTGADALMIGRAAQGNPWLFSQIEHFLQTGENLDQPTTANIGETLARHVESLYQFYGDYAGLRIARKHIAWYFKQLNAVPPPQINQASQAAEQIKLIHQAIDHLTHCQPAPYGHH